MSDANEITYDESAYQRIVNKASAATQDVMGMMHAANRQQFGNGNEESGDIVPVVAGILSGVMTYLYDNGVEEDVIQSLFQEIVEQGLPQIVMAKRAEDMGATEAGRA